jgi:hypothetical protein
VARPRRVAGYVIPGIVVVIILLAYVVHWAGGGVMHLRLGHFDLDVGFT